MKNNINRLATSALFEKPGTGMLFRNLKPDFWTKWDDSGVLMKIFMGGSSIYKAKVLFVDGEYELNDN